MATPRPGRHAETWHLGDAEVGPLIRAAHLGRRRTYQRGDYLYRQGETVSRFHFVLRGHVLVSSSREDGTEFTLEIMGRWAVCGEAAAFDGKPCFSSAMAIEETEVLGFAVADVIAAFPQRPDLAAALLRITALKQRIVAVRAKYLASNQPETRICELLHRLAELYGTQERGTTLIDMSLTHEQMATLTGTTRVTVTRTLKRMRDQGAIALEGRSIKVLDIDQLMQLSGRRPA